MGRNVNGLNLTDKEKAELARECTISDYMDDEAARLNGLLDAGKITYGYYLDKMDCLRETAEREYDKVAEYFPEPEPETEESDWDSLQEYMEAY